MTKSGPVDDTSTTAESPYTNLWKRPKDGEQPFHRYCDILPPSFYRIAGNAAEPNTDHDQCPEIQYCFGIARAALRVTPMVVAISAVLLLIDAELATTVVSLSEVVGAIDVDVSSTLGFVDKLVIGVVWAFILVGLLRCAGLLNVKELLRAALVYLLLILLLASVIASIYVITTNGLFNPHTQDDISGNVLFVSGFLLMIFLGGQLVYDGMLRTENLFWNLHDKYPPIIKPDDRKGYDEFREKLKQAFKHRCFNKVIKRNRWLNSHVDRFPLNLITSIPTVYVFAFLFAGPFYVVDRPTEPVRGVLGLVPTALDFVLVVVFFQFLVLIKYLNKLLESHGPQIDQTDESFTLQYKPLHPDGYAGFKEFGQLATRVNVLLVIGGIYVVFRLYVAGMGVYPGPGAKAPELVTWTFDYVGPVITYVVAVLVWMYFSFWRIHKSMVQGKEAAIRKRGLSTDKNRQTDEGWQTEYRLIREAPVWPINTRIFLSILSMDVLPILGALLLLFPGNIDMGWL